MSHLQDRLISLLIFLTLILKLTMKLSHIEVLNFQDHHHLLLFLLRIRKRSTFQRLDDSWRIFEVRTVRKWSLLLKVLWVLKKQKKNKRTINPLFTHFYIKMNLKIGSMFRLNGEKEDGNISENQNSKIQQNFILIFMDLQNIQETLSIRTNLLLTKLTNRITNTNFG